VLSGLRYRVVCYMVMSVLWEHSGFLFTGHRMMGQAVLTDISVSTNWITWPHNLEDYNF
jgi:hypothetical protein